MRQGVLVYDMKNGRMGIRFSTDGYYGGLHCGETMDVFMNNR